MSLDQTDTDTEPIVIKAGETTTLAWQVWVQDSPVASPYQARCKIVSAVGGSTLETPTATISGGVVYVAFTAAQTAAFTWTTGVIGVEVYDTSGADEVAYRAVQAPVTISPEVVV